MLEPLLDDDESTDDEETLEDQLEVAKQTPMQKLKTSAGALCVSLPFVSMALPPCWHLAVSVSALHLFSFASSGCYFQNEQCTSFSEQDWQCAPRPW
jgi:hypothetical protein